MQKVQLKDLESGDYFSLNENENAPLWKKGDYVRSEKRYSCTKYDDVNHEKLMKGCKIVYV